MPRVVPAPLGALGACGAWVPSTRPFLPPVTFSTDSAGFHLSLGLRVCPYRVSGAPHTFSGLAGHVPAVVTLVGPCP